MAPAAGPGYKAGMRFAVLVLIPFALTFAAAAETLRLPPAEPAGKTLPLKSASESAKESAKASACAAYGRGFMMVEGTCVKIGGSIRAGVVTSR